KRQPAEFLAQLVKKLVTGPIHPAAMNGGRLAGGNLPELSEAAKVVEPDNIAGLRRPPQAVDPPLKPGGSHRIPVVKRIAPALPGGAEGIRRNAGNNLRLQIFF